MDQKRKRAHTFQTCLRFRRMERVRMEQRSSAGEPQAGNSAGRLEELALRWFTDTQAPLILHEGNFPAWFQGFISRKDAEAKLTDKPLGCFLIRLSDKALGYILSYRGRDRCRHFVINQNKTGQFIVSGDVEPHENLTDLIEHYRASPIEPFGEFLTSSCSESISCEVYDVFQGKQREKLGVSEEAARSLCQQRIDHSQSRPPALSPKSYYRKPSASVNMDSAPQAAPPVPRRAQFLSNSLDGSLDERSTLQGSVLYAQLQKRTANQRSRPLPTNENVGPDGPRCPPGAAPTEQTLRPRGAVSRGAGIVYSELSLEDCRSQSLPLLDSESGEPRSFTSPELSSSTPEKGLDRRGVFGPYAANSGSLDRLCGGPIYQLAGMPQDPQAGQRMPPVCHQPRRPVSTTTEEEGVYAEVPRELFHPRFLADNAYELIPDEGINSSPFHDNTYELIPEQGIKKEPRPVSTDLSRTYESFEDQQPKHGHTDWSLKNDKWRRFFPEYNKK